MTVVNNDERLAVLEERVFEHLRLPIHPGAAVELKELREAITHLRTEAVADVAALRIEVRVLQARVAAYAAIGAVIGGGIADVAFNLLEGLSKR